jgi:hypothetical protein
MLETHMGSFDLAVKSNGGTTATRIPVPVVISPTPSRTYRPRGRHYRHGQRAAAFRAVTAAKAYLRGDQSSLVEAAEAHGSCPSYVAAGIVVVQSQDPVLVDAVITGTLPLLGAAESVKNVAHALVAFQRLSAVERITFGAQVGVKELWDDCVCPVLG